MLKTNTSQTRFLSTSLVGKPLLVVRIADGTSFNSKLDVVLSLVRKGWLAADKCKLKPYEKGQVRVFILQWKMPMSYFVCLLSEDELFGKGIKQIPHYEKDCYYQCLLRLREQRLREFLERAVDQKWCLEELRKARQALPLSDIPAEEPGSDEEVGAVVPLPPLQLPLADRRIQFERCVAVGPAERVKIYFDRCTGGSAGQRCYANCSSKNHSNCFQWRQAEDFSSREEIAAYFYVWSVGHVPFADRFAHMGWRPGDADLQLSAAITVEDF